MMILLDESGSYLLDEAGLALHAEGHTAAPACRTLTVAADARTYTILTDNRTDTIPADTRINTVEC